MIKKIKAKNDLNMFVERISFRDKEFEEFYRRRGFDSLAILRYAHPTRFGENAICVRARSNQFEDNQIEIEEHWDNWGAFFWENTPRARAEYAEQIKQNPSPHRTRFRHEKDYGNNPTPLDFDWQVLLLKVFGKKYQDALELQYQKEEKWDIKDFERALIVSQIAKRKAQVEHHAQRKLEDFLEEEIPLTMCKKTEKQGELLAPELGDER